MIDRGEAQKRAAALAAVGAEVRSGMTLGLGTGSTARFVLEEIGRLLREDGLALRAVPTSEPIARLARTLAIPLVDLSAVPDLAIDGADQIDPQRDLIKGRGGALTREKCVAVAARRFVIVADVSKLVPVLRRPVPIEVLAFALPLVDRLLRERMPGCASTPRRTGDGLFISDNGNPLLDVAVPPQVAPAQAAEVIAAIPGVVAHGYFLGMQPTVYVADDERVRVLS